MIACVEARPHWVLPYRGRPFSVWEAVPSNSDYKRVDRQVSSLHIWLMLIYTWFSYDCCDFMDVVCSTIVATLIAEISITAIMNFIVLRSHGSLNFGNQ